MNRLRARLRRAKGKHRRQERRALKWYLGLHERWWLEGQLGRPAAWAAVREEFQMLEWDRHCRRRRR